MEPEREEEEVDVIPPDALSFERDSYRVAWTKQRAIRIVAPPDTIATSGKTVRVTSSDAGVVVLDGGSVDLGFDDELEYYVGVVRIDARTLGAKARLVAELDSSQATATVVVARDEGGPRLQIHIRDKEARALRAIVDRTADGIVIEIMGQHPAVRRYFGAGPKFQFQDMSASHALVAEIVAGEATRIVMEKKYLTGGHGVALDAAALYADHAKYLSKYLARCHKMLVPDNTLQQAKSI